LEYHGYLDRFTVLNQCLIADGWANYQDIAAWYDGKPLLLSQMPVRRPDLAGMFGAEAESWGFAFCAALPSADVDRTNFRIRLNAKITLDDPARGFRRHDDNKFEAMTQRFRDAVAGTKGQFLEIGSRARSGVNYKSWFPDDIDYVGIDIAAGPNVDVVGDAHHLSRLLNGKFAFVFSIAVFEHILMP